MALSVPSQDDDEAMEGMKKLDGVTEYLSYPIRSVHEVKDSYGNDVILLNIRNFDNSVNWTGDWCTGSSKWTP